MITLLILPLMITPANPSVDDHATADRSVRQTHRLWVTPSAYRTDRGSPLMITLLILPLMITPLILPLMITRLRIAAFGRPTDCGSHRLRFAQTADHR